MKKIRVNFIIEPEQKQKLKELSDETRIAQSNYVREAITDLLRKYKRI